MFRSGEGESSLRDAVAGAVDFVGAKVRRGLIYRRIFSPIKSNNPAASSSPGRMCDGGEPASCGIGEFGELFRLCGFPDPRGAGEYKEHILSFLLR